MKKRNRILLKFLVVFALFFANFSGIVFASGNEIKIQFTPNQHDLDKEWKVHMWIPNTDKVYPNNVLTKNNDIFETTIHTATTNEVGYVVYHGEWVKDLGSTDRKAQVTPFTTIKVTQGVEETQIINEEVSQLIVHFKKDTAHQQHDFNIWMWHEGETGKQINFTGTDDYGQVATIQVRGKTLNQIGLKLRSNAGTANNWTLQSDGNLDVPLTQGKAEIWIDGLSSNYKTSPSPNATLTKATLTVNYLRTDNDYTGWNTWSWLRNGTVDSDSKSTQFNNKKAIITHENPAGIEKIGLIVRKSIPGNDWLSKNSNDDLIIDNLPTNGEKEIWIVENDATVYHSFDDIPVKIVNAKLNEDNTISVYLSKPTVESAIQNIIVDNYVVTSKTLDTNNNQLVTLTLQQEIRKTEDIIVRDAKFGTFTIPLKLKYLHSEEFNNQNYYDGTLGAIYTPTSTTFKLWAPTAKKVELIDYSEQNNDFIVGEMINADNHWSISVNKDTLGMKYRYRATFFDGTIREFVDPYAKATTANGTHSVVIDSQNTVPTNWNNTRMPAFGDQSKAIIYEAHIRDLTIGKDNGITNKGKFLGLTEANTKTLLNNPSGLDYLKSLGITHIQFLPMYDFDTVDETGDLSFDAQYNWGYDPLHYNVPEGSYSTNPSDPTARIKEMKQMIQTLHDNGIRVIMDVVYNHVHNTDKSPLHQSVPGYFFRYGGNGNLHNGTGVGNETASEQKMFRKYMIDSLKYWASEYNIDGFRFDLMGIHDVETMNQIRQELHKIDPSIVILGEGWDMGNHPNGIEKSHQYNAEKMPNIAFFNDVFRDSIKGDNFAASNPGYVNHANNHEFAWKILNSIKSQYVVPYKAINQNVLYNEAHDNYTLYDKLKQSTSVDEATLVRMHTHATTLQTLGYGLLFIHAGQENLRTKNNDHNSYKSPDHVNVFDYDRAQTYQQAHDYFKDLMQLRKSEALFNLNSFEEINQKVTHIDGLVDSSKIVYKVENSETYYVISNASNHDLTISIPEAEYETLVADMKVYLKENSREKFTANTVKVKPNSVSIIKKVEYADYIAVETALNKVNNYNPKHYKNYSEVENAVNNVVKDLRKVNQTVVDEMANKIEQAIANLQRKESIDVTVNGITVSFIDGNLPEFEKVEITKLDKAIPMYEKEYSDVYEVKVFDTKTNQYIQYQGNAKLTLPLQPNKTIKQTYFINQDTTEVVPFEIINDKAVLSVTHFSEYGIGYVKPTTPTPNSDNDSSVKPQVNPTPQQDNIVPKTDAPKDSITPKTNSSKQENKSIKENVDTSDSTQYITFALLALIGLLLLKNRKIKN